MRKKLFIFAKPQLENYYEFMMAQLAELVTNMLQVVHCGDSEKKRQLDLRLAAAKAQFLTLMAECQLQACLRNEELA